MEDKTTQFQQKFYSLQKCIGVLASSVTTNDIIKCLSEFLGSVTQADAACLLLTDAKKTRAGLYPLFPKDFISRKELILDDAGLPLAQLRTESRIVKNQLAGQEHPNELEKIFIEKGLVSCVFIPLKVEVSFFGVIAIGLSRQDQLLEEDMQLLETASRLASLKLENLRLFSDLQQKREELDQTKHYEKDEINKHISELKDTYTQVVQQGKMSSLGLLSAGVAHELNNPIGGILGYTQLILSKLKAGQLTQEDTEKSIKYLEMMERDAKRCQWIISNLLNFARKPLDERMPVDLAEVINNTVGIMEYQLNKANVKVIVNMPAEGLKKVSGNANELQQVFTNLIQNAADAMTEGGQVTISGKNKTEVKFGLMKDSVELVFADNGSGIPKENLNKIFDPFFTSKQGKSGTGLGLSITYTIVSSHGGFIRVESEVGKGTTFFVTLPTLRA